MAAAFFSLAQFAAEALMGLSIQRVGPPLAAEVGSSTNEARWRQSGRTLAAEKEPTPCQ